MRTDMHKVIVERPRWGGGPERHRRQQNVSMDLLPRHESMRSAHPDRKSFGENLAPLRRWLLSQVGRPWDEVYSEACQVIKPDSTVRNHIKVHLLQMVELHTFFKDGEIWCSRDGCWWGAREVPVASLSGNWTCCYVNPETGGLCKVLPRPRRASWADRERSRRANYCRWVNDDTAFLRSNGCWFECKMCPMTRESELRQFDYAQHRLISIDEAERLYGRAVFCATKRQLARRELKQHGLTNEATGLSQNSRSVKGSSRLSLKEFPAGRRTWVIS